MVHWRIFWQLMDPCLSPSSSQTPVDTYASKFWQKLPLIPTQMVWWTGIARNSSLTSTITWSHVKQIGFSLFNHWLRLKGTSACFDRNDTIKPGVVPSPAGSYHVRSAIVDTNQYVNTARVWHTSRALFAKTRHALKTYRPITGIRSCALQVLLWQVGSCHPNVTSGLIRICQSLAWTAHVSRSSRPRAAVNAII